MILKAIATAVVCVGLLAIAGCSQSESSNEQAAQVEPVNEDNTQAASAVVPVSLFATSAPAESKPLIDVKSSARQGDHVTFVARIGGRVDAFVDGRAMFFVTDSSIKTCDDLHKGMCKTPWDYCCEPKDILIKHMATVQVVDDASGQPMKTSLEHEHGLEPLRTVYVTGTVQTIDDAGNMIVNAESIYVKES